MAIPKRTADRLCKELKRYAKVLEMQRDRDVSEADTVTVVKDLLSDVFGYDKYADLTSEHAIRGTYCDLAVKLDGRIRLLMEVKAIGTSLNERHLKQATDYAANEGIDWVVLTNGIEWRLYHMVFKKPIDKDEVMSINLLDADCRSDQDLEKLFLLTREGQAKDALSDYRDRKDATSHFMIAAILLNSSEVLSSIRRELRQVSDLLIDKDEIHKVLEEQVIKREAKDGEEAENARKRYIRSENAKKRATAEKKAKKKAAADPPKNSSAEIVIPPKGTVTEHIPAT